MVAFVGGYRWENACPPLPWVWPEMPRPFHRPEADDPSPFTLPPRAGLDGELYTITGIGGCEESFTLDAKGETMVECRGKFSEGCVLMNGGKHTGFEGRAYMVGGFGWSILQFTMKSGESFTAVVYKRVGKYRMDFFPGMLASPPQDGSGLVAQLFVSGEVEREGTLVIMQECALEMPCATMCAMLAGGMF